VEDSNFNVPSILPGWQFHPQGESAFNCSVIHSIDAISVSNNFPDMSFVQENSGFVTLTLRLHDPSSYPN
jgi:hypothetical protein